MKTLPDCDEMMDYPEAQQDDRDDRRVPRPPVVEVRPESAAVMLRRYALDCRSCVARTKVVEDFMEAARVIDLLHYELTMAKAEVETLRKDAQRWTYCRDHSSWHRSEDGVRMDYMEVWVPKGSDLSCKAMRELAVDNAMKENW